MSSKIYDFHIWMRAEPQVTINRKLTAKDLTLIVCFTALYAVFSRIPISPILGMPGASITAAAITAPIIGILLGPDAGTFSVFLGGTISFYLGSFSPSSFVSGIVAALCAGLLCKGKRAWCFVVYFSFFILLGFYPSIGPAWLFPSYMWFQIVGLFLLVSPLESIAIANLQSKNNPRFLLSFFVVALTSTLAGQISGSLAAFVFISGSPNYWLGTFQFLTGLYPAERIIIALGSAFIGTPLFRILQSSNLLRTVNHERARGFP
jgi:predicted membrane protein